MRRGFTSACVVAATLVATSDARAADVDGSYGRVEGDLLFVGDVGAAVALGGVGLETHVSLLYLSTAGGYFRYVEAFGNEDAPYARLLAVGFDLRPLFLGRYALDLERGPAHLDLFVDSLSLVIGPTWTASPITAEFEAAPGIELGVGIEVPLLPSASGPYLGVLGLARWGPHDIDGTANANFLERGSSVVFTFSWHQIFDANLVDLRDPPREP